MRHPGSLLGGTLLLALATLAGQARAAPPALVFCAPGYPGTTAEAQPAMDAFAAALAERARLPPGDLAAVYHEAEAAGLDRLARPDAALALVPLPFFLAREKALRLRPLLLVVEEGGAPLERWTLWAKKGRVQGPASLAGWQVTSTAGYAPAFLRGPVLGDFGGLPPGAKVVASGAVLSSLRKAAAGEDVALVLDRAQARSVATLPFAAELEQVTSSPPLPVALVAAVAKRLPEARVQALAKALRELAGDPRGAEALAGIRLSGFAPLDEKALAAARKAYAGAAR